MAIDPELEYVRARVGDEVLVAAAPRVEPVLGEDAEVLDRFRGNEIAGKVTSRRSRSCRRRSTDRGHTVLEADFVSADDGTGLVHTAIAFGEDDFRLGEQYGLNVVNPVRPDGTYDERIGPYEGRYVKDADPDLIADLQSRGLVFRRGVRAPISALLALRHAVALLREGGVVHPHDRTQGRPAESQRVDRVVPVPHQARALRQVAREQRRLGPVARALLGHAAAGVALREGTTGAWARWPSCASWRATSQTICTSPTSTTSRLRCPDCGEEMRRVPEVIDAWFDSGAMPFAQFHHPLDNEELFEQRFPADFICEALDQTRGWFYSLLVESVLLFGQASYKNVLCLGLILDPDGQKMSKSRGNVIAPWDVIEPRARTPFGGTTSRPSSRGRDIASRSRRGERAQVPAHAVEHVQLLRPVRERRRIRSRGPDRRARDRPALDRWALSRLQNTVAAVRDELDDYDTTTAGRSIAAFVDDLSNWYVRRSRRRFWRSGDDSEAESIAAYLTLHESS